MRIKRFNKKLRKKNNGLFLIKVIYEFYIYELKLLED